MCAKLRPGAPMSPQQSSRHPRAALHAVLQRRQRVEIHQQQRARERGEVDVDQLLLDRPAGQVRSPAFAPVADRRDIHMIQVGMAVVALSRFDDQRAPDSA